MSENYEARVVEGVEKRLFIDGKWLDASDGRTFDVTDAPPASHSARSPTHRPTTAWPHSTQPVPPAGVRCDLTACRADILTRAFELLHERVDDLALLMTLEMGKPVAEACGEITYAADFFRHFAEEAVRIDGGYQTAPTGEVTLPEVTRQPVGPCLLITPWNFPMAMGTRKLGPAIAAGCTKRD